MSSSRVWKSHPSAERGTITSINHIDAQYHTKQALSRTDAVLGHRRHPLPDADALVARLRALGVNDDTQVVAYDRQGSMYAARLWWLLRFHGFDQVQVLDGGLAAWDAAGGALQAGPVAPRLPATTL